MAEQQLLIPAQSSLSQAALKSALMLQRSGQNQQAKAKAEQLLISFPQCAACIFFNYQLAQVTNGSDMAEEYIQAALKLRPEHPLLLLSYAQFLVSKYRYTAAVKFACNAANAYTGTDCVFLAAISKVIMQTEQATKAIPIYQRMLDIEPDNTHFKHQLALCYFFTNQAGKAGKLLDDVISNSSHNAGAYHLRSALQTYTKDHNHIEALKSIVATENQHPAIYFALAKELEDIADYKASFVYLMKGASKMRQRLSYNEKAELDSISDIINSTTGLVVDGKVTAQPGPIFVVGMPRTGTTLVERVLTQHKAVHSVGELALFPQLLATMAQEHLASNGNIGSLHEAALCLDFAELGRRYMAAVEEMSGGKPYTLDKLPVNFLYCGFIKKALPNARIIHLCRNAMDSCYAIFKTFFINAYSFSYNLDELTNYYITYRNVMTHWHKVMPGAILDVHYEDMVSNAPKTTKQLVEWCGLAYTPELLEFHKTDSVSTTASAAQVRKPIYKSSVEKWRNVESELSEVKLKLQQAGIEC